MAEKKINFEEMLKELDDIVEKISSQTLPIDESLSLYERAKQITYDLQKSLDEAKAKVENIIK